jgi:hypothetical protein
VRGEASAARLRELIEGPLRGLWLPVEGAMATVAMVPHDVVNPPTCILIGPSSSAKTTVLDLVGELP